MRFSVSLFLLFLVGAGVLLYGVFLKNAAVPNISTHVFPSSPTTKSVKGVPTDSSISARQVTSVTDGDTFTLDSKEKVRLIGINTPEVGQPSYAKAKETLASLILNKNISLQYDVEKKDSHGRTLAYVYVGNAFVNLELIKKGVTVIETIPPNVAHVNEFVSAQKEARAACLGIWEGLCHPGQSACVQIATINATGKTKNDEFIEFKNACSVSLNMKGYLVKDSSASNSYTFSDFTLSGSQSVKLHSGCSKNTLADVYWQCPEKTYPVWNNSGDHAYLYDAAGQLISEMGY